MSYKNLECSLTSWLYSFGISFNKSANAIKVAPRENESAL